MNRQAGLSLVELMVAMAVSAAIIAGIIQMFLSNRTAYNMTESSIRVQENGRFALDFIAESLRSAGSYGCLSDYDSSRADIVNHITSNTFSDLETVQTAADAEIGSTADGATVANAFDKPDALTLLVPTENTALVTGFETATKPTLKISGDGTFFDNQYVLVSNCLVGDFIELDSGSNNQKIIDATSSLRTDFYSLGNMVNEVTEVNVLKYAVDTDTNTLQSTLFSYSTDGISVTTNQLVGGVENMQLQYGVDTNGDGTPDYYDSITKVRAQNDVDDIVSVKIFILAVSGGDTSSDNVVSTPQTLTMAGQTVTFTDTDRRLRRVFEKTVVARNRIN